MLSCQFMRARKSLLVLCVLLPFAGPASSSPTPAPASPVAAPPVEVVCEPSGIRAAFPSGYEVRSTSLREGQVFLARKGSDAYVQLRIEKTVDGKTAADPFWNPLETHANAQMSEEMRVMRKLKVSGLKSSTWKGRDALERTATWEGPGGERIKGRRFWFVDGGRIFCLVCHAPEGAYAAGLAEADAVRDSLAIPAGTGAPGSR